MSVLIKGMEMPERCVDCRFRDEIDATCIALNDNSTACITGKPKWCPLTEVSSADVDELQKTKWIPVTERLPKAEYGESEDVLTIDSLKVMRVAYFDGGNWCYPTGEVISTTCKFHITHWMPLPEPPKEE